MYLAHKHGETAHAQRLAATIAPLTAALFRETSPAPLKFALSLFGLMSPRVRLPLVELTVQSRFAVDGVVAQLCQQFAESMAGKLPSPAPGASRIMTG
jgi:4-hydroxy-tetrahydrodipicolinate synthase